MHNQSFWETCWQRGSAEEYSTYLAAYYQKQDPVVDLLKEHNTLHVCDAACGFGAYSLMLASNGFQVEGFDIAPTSVEITKQLLSKYGIDTEPYKVASVLDTGYDSGCFDAVTARSVLDHLTVADAKQALEELLRIVKNRGIVVVSFDTPDEEDFELPHDITEDGSLLYLEGKRRGMVFHHYSDDALDGWLRRYHVIFSYKNSREERFFAIQKDA